jgi:glycosyltransferase involved in cell wall biosynthesis
MKKVALVLKGYPRLSETFIAQEILEMEKAGIDLIIYSLRHPTDKEIHPIHREINAKVIYLPEYLYLHPRRVLSGFVKSIRYGNFSKLLGMFFKDLLRDFTANRVRRFGQGMVLYNEIHPDREWIYAHFLHTPASVARYCSVLSSLPWSCSAHAKDIWTSQKWELTEKISDLQWLVTCTKSNHDFLGSLTENPEKINLLYHGLDLARFPLKDSINTEHIEGKKEELIISSVGRAVNKKGYDILLQSLSSLPAKLAWRFIHIGGGELSDKLKSQAISLGIHNRIEWKGAQSSEAVLALYRQADIFVLPSRIDKTGDRDGLPNVIMEAMSQRLPCIATRISGIPEIIVDGSNGLLVEPDDSDQLTDAIVKLWEDTNLRKVLGIRARDDIVKNFSLNSSITQLLQKFV